MTRHLQTKNTKQTGKVLSLPKLDHNKAKKTPFVAELDQQRVDKNLLRRKKTQSKANSALPGVQLSSSYLADIEKQKSAEMAKRQSLKWTGAQYKAKLGSHTTK